MITQPELVLPDTPKSLSVNVYRQNGQDTTNNGITSYHDSLDLFYDRNWTRYAGSREFCGMPSAVEKELADMDLMLCRFRINESFPYTYYATPWEFIRGTRQPMFGGNFVYTSDSRFPVNAPLKVFDRVEF